MTSYHYHNFDDEHFFKKFPSFSNPNQIEFHSVNDHLDYSMQLPKMSTKNSKSSQSFFLQSIFFLIFISFSML